MDCKVSIIMPAYNAEKFISKSIDSIKEQTFHDWELIVVDDCSTDNTPELVEEIATGDPRISIVKLNKNYGGPAGPRNQGVRLASAELVAFCDSDDLWHPKKLEIQMGLYTGEKNFFCASKIKNFYQDLNVTHDNVDCIQVEDITFIIQSLKSRIPTSSVVISRSLVLNYKFNEDKAYKAVEDYHCWLRVLDSGTVCRKVLNSLVHYRISDGQISASKLTMLKKVFMVHRNYPERSIFMAFIYTCSHALGGLYAHLIKREM
ncbi:glycosyltransferase family 2 protein [Neptuniibacter sp.]|uniref:glycosyltransferase family 2 protein n=1 Tax=Neptuniibacter sp. TaxID=1962643 RepID=UPI003B5BA04D